MYLKARAKTVTGYKLQQHFPKRKYTVHKLPMEVRTDLITNHPIKVI